MPFYKRSGVRLMISFLSGPYIGSITLGSGRSCAPRLLKNTALDPEKFLSGLLRIGQSLEVTEGGLTLGYGPGMKEERKPGTA